MRAYLRFDVARLLRNRRFIGFLLIVPVAFTLLYGQIFTGAAVADISFQAYYMVSLAAFGAVGAALQATAPRISAERTSGWLRQLRTTPLRPLDYFLTKVVLALGLTIPAVAIVEVISGLVNGVRLGWDRWLEIALALPIGTVPFAAIGTVLGLAITGDGIMPVTMGSLFVMSFLGGLWTPVDDAPGWFHVVSELMPTYHYNEIGLGLLSGQQPGLLHVAVLAAYTAGFALLAVWLYTRDQDRQGA